MSSEKILITGIRSGIGHALAQKCLENGAFVYAINRRPPEFTDTYDRLKFESFDLGNFDEIPAVIGRLLEGVEHLDLVVLNSGVLGELKDLSKTSIDECRHVMDINVWANKVLLDALFATKLNIDHIVGISSGASKNGSGGWGPYSISKAALNILLRVSSAEHPETHFNSLAPGIVDTPMVRKVISFPKDPRHQANSRVSEAVSEGRAFTPDEVAAKILAALPILRKMDSGSYADVRELDL